MPLGKAAVRRLGDSEIGVKVLLAEPDRGHPRIGF